MALRNTAAGAGGKKGRARMRGSARRLRGEERKMEARGRFVAAALARALPPPPAPPPPRPREPLIKSAFVMRLPAGGSEREGRALWVNSGSPSVCAPHARGLAGGRPFASAGRVYTRRRPSVSRLIDFAEWRNPRRTQWTHFDCYHCLRTISFGRRPLFYQ